MPMLTRRQGGGNKTATTSFINVSKNNNNNNNNDDSEIISMDYTTYPPPASGGREQHVISLSKKGLHQRDADENLFLRFLELDPPGEVSAALSAQVPDSSNAASGSSTNRPPLSKPIGRTPFTVTKKLTRTAERGFGFSIVWTHPPRVEKTEPGLPADRSGILPGDYVIFVEKHNVVTMPEADVLNLIRSQGNALTLEIFRRPGSGLSNTQIPPALSTTTRAAARSTVVTSSNTNLAMNGRTSRIGSTASNYGTMTDDEFAGTVGHTLGPAASSSQCGTVGLRPSTACSVTSSVEAAKRRLNLPQVTFSKESISPITDNRRRFLLQLISREQNFISALHFGMQRFVQPLQERKDLISPNDHRTLFQNIDELLRISEDILEQLCSDEQEPQMNFASRVYLSKTTAICAAYKKYWNGIKRADCVLVNKSRQTSSEFIHFITEPQVPRKRPDLCMLIHRPLQHFREILKLMQLLSSHCHVDSEEHKNFTSVIVELQAAYREITVSSGLMEPLGEGRPLLTLQDLESRMVFTKCKPFTLAVQGRQWIFGGDLSRIEGRSVKPYWTLLFSDIIVFAKVSRDRVLFITEEPIPIANIVDSCFHMRKKTTEFRLTVDPNGRLAESPTGYCAPDLTRTPKKNARRKSLMLRAPSLELKAVWQNLLQRQIFLVNAALGSTPLSSPLDSPDVLNTLVPLSDMGVVSASIGSIKLSSVDSINLRNQQQVRLLHSKQLSIGDSYENLQRLAYTLASRCSTRMTQTSNTSCSSQTASPAHFPVPAGDSMLSLRSLALGRRHLHHQLEFGSPLVQRAPSDNNSSAWLSLSGSSINTQSQLSGLLFASGSGEYLPVACKCLTAIPEAAGECLNVQESLPLIYHQNCGVDNDEGKTRKSHTCPNNSVPPKEVIKVETTVSVATPNVGTSQKKALPKLHEFSLNSVGRSFIDDSNEAPSVTDSCRNISDSTDKSFDGFSNDFVLHKKVSQDSKNMGIPLAQFGGSWDLLELDLNLHEVNMDPCFDTDVEECIFMGDEGKCGGDVGCNGEVDDDNDNFLAAKMTVSDPFGVLPTKPTPPDSLEL